MDLERLEISQFRSIGVEPVCLDFSRRVVVLAGQNNAGKSNVLEALQYLARLSNSRLETEELDRHHRRSELHPRFKVTVRISGEDLPYTRLIDGGIFDFSHAGTDMVYANTPFTNMPYANFRRCCIDGLDMNADGSLEDVNLPRVKNELADKIVRRLLKKFFARVEHVPEIRSIAGGETPTNAGVGVISMLAEWQHPPIGKEADRRKFDSLERFLRQHLGLPDLRIEVPRAANSIILSNGPLRLPRDQYGEGTRQLIILTIDALQCDNALVCI